MNSIKNQFKECYNTILKKDLIVIELKKIFIILNLNKNLKRNLIFQKEFNQDKVLLEQLKNVKLMKINNIMQLNILNKQKDKLIFLNYKLVNKLNKILLIIKKNINI